MPILDRNLASIFPRDFDYSLEHFFATRRFVCHRSALNSRDDFSNDSFDPCHVHYHRFISRTVQLPLFISLERDFYRYGADRAEIIFSAYLS